MPRSFTAGLAEIRRLAAARVDIGEGNCKQRAREAFVIASNGTPTAAASWLAAPDQHRTTNPNDAPPCSFGWMTGGATGAGHVVVIDEQGAMWTPGGPAAAGRWYRTTAAELLRGWPNLRWVGWTRSIDGQYPALPKPVAPEPKPTVGQTKVKQARVILRAALKQARTQGNKRRVAKIRAGLKELPKR